MNDHSTKFKLGTGAFVCVISDSVLCITFNKPQQTFGGTWRTKLKVMGAFITSMKYRQNMLFRINPVPD